MALIAADANGILYHLALSAQAERMLPPPTQTPAATVRLDDAANAALLARINADSRRFRLAANGTLTEDDAPVEYVAATPPPPAIDPAAIGLALAQLPDDAPLTKADLAPLLALFGAGTGQTG